MTKLRPELMPIRSQRMLGDEVTRQVRDAIMSGAYASGEKLVAGDLAARLGVSTTPVREALAALAHEGILEVSPRRGFRVAALDKGDIEDIFRIQAFLAGVLAERAAALIDEKELDRLRRIQDKVRALAAEPDGEQLRARIEYLNYSFHRTMNRVVGAGRLDWFWRAATQYVPRYVYETIPTWTQLTVADHPGLIDALERHDGPAARRRAEEHVMHAGAQVVANLEARGFFSPRSVAAAASSV